MQITVADTGGNPVENSFVTLIKGTSDTTEELYTVGKTDSQGRVSLAFYAESSGPMTLTVSGRNLYPYQSQVEIVNSSVAVDWIRW